MTDSTPPVTTKQAMPFDSLLAQSRDLVSERLALALGGMLEKVDETLSELVYETQDHELRKLYMETKDKALKQRKAIAEQFRTLYLREFHARSNRVKKIGQSFSELDSSSLELDLVGEDDLNETLKVNDMATKLRQYCDDELGALDQRVGVLLGDASLGSEDNPFSPQAICDAFKNTCRSLVSEVKVRMIFLKLFDDHVLDDIRSVYKAVNALLVQNSILPKIRYGVSRGKDGGKVPPSGARAGEEPSAVARAAESVAGGETDFFSVMRKLLASSVNAMTQAGAPGGAGVAAQGVAGIPGFPAIVGAPGLGGAVGAPVVVLQGAELMNMLTRVQHGDASAVVDGALSRLDSDGVPGTTNVLRELKNTSVGSGMNQMDVVTLDIVAMLFDQLFDDPKIPIAVKGLIGRMQIPMLKVAIADKAFFSKKNHPARRLLDTLGEISSRLPADFNASNPLFGHMEDVIHELIKDFQDNVEIFDVVRERLQTLFDDEGRRVDDETQAAARRIELDERLAASKTMAEFEVRARVQAGKLPRPVIEFLVHQWVKPLLIVHVRRGQHSDAWKNSLATMDLLIWSVEVKHSPEERSKLAEAVPDLLKRLAAGLKIADIDDAIRERFFSDLEKLHSEATSEGGEGEIAAAPDASEETGATPDIAFTGIPVPEHEETVELVPATAVQAPEPSPIEFLEPKEIVPPTHELAIELPDLPTITLPEREETVQPISAVAAEVPELLPPIDFSGLKEAVQPIPETAGRSPAPPGISIPEPSQPAKPTPPPSAQAPAPPRTPAPAPSQPAKPPPPPSAQAPAPPRTPAPAPGQPAKPTPPPSTQAPAPTRTPMPDPRQSVRPAPPSSTRSPSNRAPVPDPKQTVKPIPATAGPALPSAGKPMPVSKETGKAVPPSAPRAPASANKPVPVSRETVRAIPPSAPRAPAPATRPGPVSGQSVKAIPPSAPRAPAPASRPGPVSGPTARAIAPSGPRATAPLAAQDADSFSLDFTKSLTIKNPFGGGKVNVKELDSDDAHPAGAPRAKGAANEVEFIKNLKEGMWVEFREKDGNEARGPAKLSYISPLRSSFLFVDKLGKTVKECSRTELGRLVRLNLVAVVEVAVAAEAPLFDRMMAGVIGKLS